MSASEESCDEGAGIPAMSREGRYLNRKIEKARNITKNELRSEFDSKFERLLKELKDNQADLAKEQNDKLAQTLDQKLESQKADLAKELKDNLDKKFESQKTEFVKELQEQKLSFESTQANLVQRFESSRVDFIQKFESLQTEINREMKEQKISLEESQASLSNELREQISSLGSSLSRLEVVQNATQDQLNSIQEEMSVIDDKLETHIKDSKEEKAQLKSDIVELTQRLDNINISISNEAEKYSAKLRAEVQTEIDNNNTLLRKELSSQSELLRQEIQEAIEELSTRIEENSSIENPVITQLSQQVEKDHEEIINIRVLISEICNNTSSTKDNSNVQLSEQTNINSGRGAENVGRVNNTEFPLREINETLVEGSANDNILTNNYSTANMARNDSRTNSKISCNDHVVIEKILTNDNAVAASSSRCEIVPLRTNHECHRYCGLPGNVEMLTKVPTFNPEEGIHPVIFLRAIECSFAPNWTEQRKIQFVIGQLEGNATEWAILNRSEFKTWIEFTTLFKEKYWSKGEQQRLTLELLDPPYYSKRWGGFRKYFEWHLNRVKLIEQPIMEDHLIRVLISRLPYSVKEKMIEREWSRPRDLLNYLEQLDNLNKEREDENLRNNRESNVRNNNNNKTEPRKSNNNNQSRFCQVKRPYREVRDTGNNEERPKMRKIRDQGNRSFLKQITKDGEIIGDIIIENSGN